MDGVHWNGDSFICPGNVDEREVYSDIDSDDYEEEPVIQVANDHIISILDIARQAKPKGMSVMVSLPAES